MDDNRADSSAVVYEPWMTLHPNMTLQQWQAHRDRMSASEWESYRDAWRAEYMRIKTAPQTSVSAPIPAPVPQHMAAPAQGVYYGSAAPVRAKKRTNTRKFFGAIWPFFVYLGVSTLLSIIVILVLFIAVVPSIDYGMGFDELYNRIMAMLVEWSFYLNVFIQVSLFLVFAAFFIKYKKHALTSAHPGIRALDLAFVGMIASAGLWLLVSGALSGLDRIIQRLLPDFLSNLNDLMDNLLTSGPGWLSVLSIVVFAPLLEEFMMRGLVQKRLSRFMRKWPSILIASALFGILHAGPIQVTYAFALGVFLGWIYNRCDNILVPIFAHMAFNGMNFIPVFAEFAVDSPWISALVGAGVAAAAILGYRVLSKPLKRKYCIVIGDGMADHPVKELDWRTPLQAANIPVMDELAAQSVIGCLRTVPEGVPAGSDTAILSVCGYDPRKCYTGRAPLEAAGADVPLMPGDAAYRCNLISLEDGDMPYHEKRILSHSGGSVDGESALTLMRDLLEDPEFAAAAGYYRVSVYPAASFRQIAVQQGVDVTGLLAAPPHDHLGEAIGPLLPRYGPADSLNTLMHIAHVFLDRHEINEKRRAEGKPPANGIWFWAEGTAAFLPPLKDKYKKRGFVVSAVPLVRGIGALAGMERVIIPGATGELDTDFEGKTDAVLHGLNSGFDFAVLHIEAPDECTHAGDLEGKLQAIEWLDSRAIARLKQGLDRAGKPYRLLILSDHLTLTETHGHNGEPVPFLLYDSRAKRKPIPRGFSEASCEESGILIEEGHELIGKLLDN